MPSLAFSKLGVFARQKLHQNLKNPSSVAEGRNDGYDR
jgi:hypothetical protein